MKKKLPIGIQSFEEIRIGDYYYVDKTPFVPRLSERGKYYFLSRPRRFGKSLFLDTLRQAFLGRKDLFEGLYLYDNWDWSKSYPVVYVDFGGRSLEGEDSTYLKTWILRQIEENGRRLGIECRREDDYAGCFEELIVKAYEKYRQHVVVLIDEYDKPILDRIEEKEEAKKNREVLKNFYSVLKPLDRYLKFVFITGVSKFSKVSLFSGLNQLNDITLDPKYGTICGYTQEELEKVFEEELRGEDLSLIKCWYDGYSFCGESVYNPFDILLYLDKRLFRPYWFETGTPTFLVKLLAEKKFFIPEMEEFTVSDDLLDSFDVDFIEPENILFQAGYLTVNRTENLPSGIVYHLSYPNKEVKVSLNRALLRYLAQSTEPGKLTTGIYEILRTADFSRLERIFRALFASIPYDWCRRNELSGYEGFYTSVIYSFLASTGLNLIAEDSTNNGRVDLTVIHEKRVYIIEFKVMEEEGEKSGALEVLKSRGYAEKYRGKYEEIYLIGIDFSSIERNIARFDWEKAFYVT